jgi:membrane-bound lytic murein transglycosylase F
VVGEDRLKFALAAYNIGLGHVFDAQKLAQQMGLNQNSWPDLKRVLPLLSQKKYYKPQLEDDWLWLLVVMG